MDSGGELGDTSDMEGNIPIKAFLVYFGLYSVLPYVCCDGKLTQGANSQSLQVESPKNLGRQIVGALATAQDRLLLTTVEPQGVDETCVRVLKCNLTGQIQTTDEFVIDRVVSIHVTNDPEIPVTWIKTTGHGAPVTELWFATHESGQLQEKVLLRQGPADRLSMQKCWLFNVGDRKTLFVQKYAFEKTRLAGELYLTPAYSLARYALENGTLKVQRDAPIGEGKTSSDEFTVECAVADGNVAIWVCEHQEKWSKSTLRFARWHDDGQFEWTECYKGADVSELFSMDRAYGSAVGIFEQKENQPYFSGIICQLPGRSPECVNLGYGFGGKHQLLAVEQGEVRWLLSNYEAWNLRVHALDDKLQQVKVVKKSYPNSTDAHIVRGIDRICYVVILMGDQLKIEKLEELPIAQGVPEDLAQGLSEEMIAEAYREYIQGEGKKFVKATNKQLEQDIISGEEESAIISYYRLLSRNEKLAKDRFTERIRRVVKEALGEEHWITNMELAFYGQPAIEPLLRIAATKGGEERQIALEALYSVPDPNVAEELTKLLVRADVRKDVNASLMICDIGLRAGREEAIDFLIKGATGKFQSKGDPGTEELIDESRRVLIELTRDYEDTPETWSEEEWVNWWKTHGPSIKMRLQAKVGAEEMEKRKSLKREHRLFSELANMLEKDTQAGSG